MRARETATKANIEQDLRLLGLQWTVDVHRLMDGYTLQLSKGSKTFVQRGIDEAVLEDAGSSARDRIFAKALLELEGTPDIGSAQ
jgi:hypothetical protein